MGPPTQYSLLYLPRRRLRIYYVVGSLCIALDETASDVARSTSLLVCGRSARVQRVCTDYGVLHRQHILLRTARSAETSRPHVNSELAYPLQDRNTVDVDVRVHIHSTCKNI